MAVMLAKAQPLLDEAASEGRHAPPRLLMESLLNASWTDSDDVQQMWAGLVASSCTQDGTDDSNWIFIGLLERLTAMQVAVLKTACEEATKFSAGGLIYSQPLPKTLDELITLTGCRDVQRLDRELDHLRVLGLIEEGLHQRPDEPIADIHPTPLGLHLYVRSQGSLLSPLDYFNLSGRSDGDNAEDR